LFLESLETNGVSFIFFITCELFKNYSHPASYGSVFAYDATDSSQGVF